MTDQELIQELRDYTHNFTKYPFNPGTASLIARRLEELLDLMEDKTQQND